MDVNQMAHGISDVEVSTATEPSLEELLERAVHSRPSGCGVTNSNSPRFSTPEELEYMQAVVKESREMAALREFIVRLCPLYAVQLVEIEFGLEVNRHTGYCPTVCMTTREDVSAWVRKDVKELVLRMLHLMDLDACGYQALVISETEERKRVAAFLV
ncbi:hypothetical protein P170DRAFT_438124 [Aspergillus steynii IBT 23096]|uniref:Uncharacterized protein n=1 Tax=Aspergillus steynii IBT 23096 TaxID=1392250 RepID=A0A2I2G6P1_9EURO|nr:uncharacterized protein P170DRAFT_438124 [Aspergillus steynii IBT 23096]PLB48545.1 hypothetical protein P170DRAFT_438124 [Aspergillus steynii IBT 23096]